MLQGTSCRLKKLVLIIAAEIWHQADLCVPKCQSLQNQEQAQHTIVEFLVVAAVLHCDPHLEMHISMCMRNFGFGEQLTVTHVCSNELTLAIRSLIACLLSVPSFPSLLLSTNSNFQPLPLHLTSFTA